MSRQSDSTGDPPRRKPPRDRKKCAYCAKAATTVDHVPPRCVYGDLPPHAKGVPQPNLITVPSCASCNHRESGDDEYFRDAMAMMSSTPDGTVPDSVYAAMNRSVIAHSGSHTPPVAVLRRSSIRGYAAFPGTSVVQPGIQVPIRWDRIRRTVERIFRGLYWNQTGMAIPTGLEIDVITRQERDRFGTIQRDEFEQMARASLAGVRTTVMKGVFSFACNVLEDRRSAVLVTTFYNSALFLAIVAGPVEQGIIALP